MENLNMEQAIDYIIKNNSKYPAQHFMDKFGLSLPQVTKIRKDNNLIKNKRLTEEQKEYIIANFQTSSVALAKEMGVPASTIRSVWQRSGIKKKPMAKITKDQFAKDYETRNIREMAELYKVSRHTISKFARTHNIPLRHIEKTQRIKNNELEMCELYKTSSIVDIAKKYDIDPQTVVKVLDKNNTPKSKNIYHLEHNYFNSIDNKNKAYFLGFIAADGCVFQRNNSNVQPWLAVGIHHKDIEVLEKLRAELNTVKPIYRSGDYVSLQIVSSQICQDLKKYNIEERKTWSYEPIALNKDLMSHFIRGYFDGDGSICYEKDDILSRGGWSLCGNEQTMQFIYNFLINQGFRGFSMRQDDREKYSQKFFTLQSTSITGCYSFLKYIYNNCEDYKLNRKYLKAMDFINNVESLKSTKPSILKKAINDYNAVLKRNL